MHEYKNKVRVYKREEHELLPGQFFSDEPGVYIEVLYNAVFIFCQRLVYVVFFKWFTMSLQPGWVRDQAGDSPEVFCWKAQSQYIVITISPPPLPPPPQKRQKISFDVDTWRLTLLSIIESTFTKGGGKEESSQSCSWFWPFPPLQACLPCSFWTEVDQVQFVDQVIRRTR